MRRRTQHATHVHFSQSDSSLRQHVLFFFCRFFFALLGEKRTYQGNSPVNITLIIPALNEAACIAPLLADWRQAVDNGGTVVPLRA